MYSLYLSDKELAQICSEECFIEYMVAFEVILASSQAKLGIIPDQAARDINATLPRLSITPDDLADGTLHHGTPVLPFLERCRKDLSAETRPYMHFGTTSQDVMDTAQVLIIKDSLVVLEKRIHKLCDNLENLQTGFGDIPCMFRTRNQLALPGTFGSKITAWLNPLRRHIKRISEIKPRLLTIQLGGPVGTLDHFGKKSGNLADMLAEGLGLASAPPWHAQRDTICEFTGWLTILTGVLGKMGADLLLMMQNEVQEIREQKDSAGHSSAMPHKRNPVLSEALVSLAVSTTSLQAQLYRSLVHTGERDGASWMLEWQTVPQMIINAGTSLKHALRISQSIEVNSDRMRQNVEEFLRLHRPEDNK